MHAAVCDFILDCVQNSIEASATEISLDIEESFGLFSVEIKDNGIGMTDDELKKAVDPFFTDGLKHKERKVGLGLPFLIQAVQQVDGDWALDSLKGKGTELRFTFNLQHVDTPPLGDVSAMLLQAFMFDGDFELEFEHRIEKIGFTGSYNITKAELIEVLGDLNDAESLVLARQFLRSQEADLTEGDV